jgi:hypothetical protein
MAVFLGIQLSFGGILLRTSLGSIPISGLPSNCGPSNSVGPNPGWGAGVKCGRAIDSRQFVKQVRLLCVGKGEKLRLLGSRKFRGGKVALAGRHEFVYRVRIGTAPLIDMLMTTVRIIRAAACPAMVAVGIGSGIVDVFAWHGRYSSHDPLKRRLAPAVP